MRGLVPMDGSAVVIARHGLQWWAGYFLKTPVREEHATKEQLDKYEHVFVLTEKRRGGEEGFGRRGRPDEPDQFTGGRDMRRAPGGGSMIGVPQDAEIVHDGVYYRLVRRS